MRPIFCALGLLLASTALARGVKATPAATAAVAAKKAIGAKYDGAYPTAERQAVMSASALAEDAAELPDGWKNTLKAIADVPDETRPRFLAAALDELAPAYAKATCGLDLDALSKVAVKQLIDTCKLAKKKLLPSQPTATLNGASLLFSAALVERLQKQHASPEQLALARWLAHLGRSDAAAAGFANP